MMDSLGPSVNHHAGTNDRTWMATNRRCITKDTTMNRSRITLAACLGMVVLLTVMSALAADPAWPLVAWKPIADNPVFTGTGQDTWDRKIRERGYILVGDDGTYHLWYTGYAGDKPTTMSLGHATSKDGVHWTRDQANPIFSESWVEDMCVVRHDGTFFMFAEGKNDIAHLLTSSDGLKWADQGSLDIRKTDGTPISPGPYGTPAAWFENGVWYLFYERGDQGVWLATSKDLKVWTNSKDDPVIARGPEPYDQTAVAVNQIVKRDGFYYAFYHANSQRPWRDWTTCVARSRDLVHWDKYAGNPIIGNNCSSAILVKTPQGEDRLYTMHPDVKVFVPR
jgi:sucrose-6-phosphate hydrolase SacC (GH32 family)